MYKLDDLSENLFCFWHWIVLSSTKSNFRSCKSSLKRTKKQQSMEGIFHQTVWEVIHVHHSVMHHWWLFTQCLTIRTTPLKRIVLELAFWGGRGGWMFSLSWLWMWLWLIHTCKLPLKVGVIGCGTCVCEFILTGQANSVLPTNSKS